MRSAIGCPHCHTSVWTDGPTWPTCPRCSHRADLPRVLCDCPTCGRTLPIDALRASVARRLLAIDGDTDV